METVEGFVLVAQGRWKNDSFLNLIQTVTALGNCLNCWICFQGLYISCSA